MALLGLVLCSNDIRALVTNIRRLHNIGYSHMPQHLHYNNLFLCMKTLVLTNSYVMLIRLENLNNWYVPLYSMNIR